MPPTSTTTPKTSATTANRPRKINRQVQFCLKFSAFIFSHVGLGFIVLMYTIFGAFIFKQFEEPNVYKRNALLSNLRNKTVNKLWTETYKLNVLYKENWTSMAIKEIEEFQLALVEAFKDGYTPAIEEKKFYSRWSFLDSWMYSISIITTIGHTNRPLTTEGKISTIIYAFFGIPIMLLFLSTIGNLFGRGLKFVYRFFCICSSDPTNSFINLNTGHDHHHHHSENYQVHHIAMNNITSNNCTLKTTCNDNSKNYSAINHNITQQQRMCSCENDTKLFNDHVCPEKYNTFLGHSHNFACVNDDGGVLADATTYAYGEDLRVHPSLTNSVNEENIRESVPFYFCFFLIAIYILMGSLIFYLWAGWTLLDGAYFCFLTLSTVGYGEVIPEKVLSSSPTESKKRIILIVIYIIGGMTLIAMSFNIIYEQLSIKLKNLRQKFRFYNEKSPDEYSTKENYNCNQDLKIMNSKFISFNEDIDV